MKRLLAAALLAASPPASAAETLAGPYSAEILRVIDGDTVVARVHVWLDVDITTHIRLRGIDAPELHGHCPGERAAATASRDALVRLLGGTPVSVSDIGVDKYGGRVDARLRLPDGRDIGTTLLTAGHALPAGRGRVRRCRP